MNEIVKVYSHERSGTNLLCEVLYQNYFSNNEKVNFKYKADINIIKKTYTRDDETANFLENPSIYLFGDHEHFAKSTARYNTKKSIYIYRNPKDTLYSLYNVSKQGLPWGEKISNNLQFKEWLTAEKINNWKNHVLNFQKNVYYIKYEDLINDHEKALKRIEKQFNIKKIIPHSYFPSKLIGWLPLKGGAYDFDDNISKKFKDVLNENFLNYNI